MWAGKLHQEPFSKSLPSISFEWGRGLRATVNFLGTRQINYSVCYTGPENPDVKNPNTYNQAAHTAQPGRIFLTIQFPLLFAPTHKFLPNTHSSTESSPNLVEE